MKIAIAGDAGSGKSSVAKLVAQKLGYSHYSIGDFMREIAAKRGISILELSRAAEKDETIDAELDDMQINLGKFEDNFVIDSRLGWHFVPDALKIFLKTDEKVSAERIFSDKRGEEHENTTAKETLENIKKRKESEIKRYREYYKLNPYELEHYDLIIDTTDMTIEKTAGKILEFIEKNK